MPLDYNAEDAVKVWPKADYEAVLLDVTDTTSKRKPDGTGGHPMQVWTWEVYHPDGRKQEIVDYVVIPGATFKIKQLAQALGKEREFTSGTFQADGYVNSNVTLALVIEEQVGYDDKNKVGRIKPLARAGVAGAIPGQKFSPANKPAPRQRQAAAQTFDQQGPGTDGDIPF